MSTEPISRQPALAPAVYFDRVEAHAHSVQFYGDDGILLDGLVRFIGAALGSGSSSIVIATKAHRDGLTARLRTYGLDMTVAAQQGRFMALDAAETLSRFMVNGWPDATLFHQVVGSVVQQARASSRSQHKRIAAFGEMVALLWAEGKSEAAIRLEQLWNELAKKQEFHLHCAYPIAYFHEEKHGALMQKVCAEHSHVLPDETYTALPGDQEKLHAIALLQQKAQALATEVAERKKAQYELQLREAELTDFFENAVISMHWVDGNGTILWANKAELALLGYERSEYIGHHIAEFYVEKPVIEDILQRLSRNEELHGHEAALRCKDGSIRYVRIHSNVFSQGGKFIHTRCFTIDITERKKLEQALLMTEKLASVGRLAASIAHEINNPLEAVTNLLYLAKRDLHDREKADKYLQSAGYELERVAHITRQTLGFYRDTCSPVTIKPSQALDDVLALYGKKIEARNIRVVKEYDDHVTATVLEGEIRQVFSNLVANAIDAMSSGGTLRLRVSSARKWQGEDPDAVRVTVADSGCGISAEFRSKLFQPFNTTKADVGTGLGLWITRGIVEKHGGRVQVKSSISGPDRGTTFSILLPRNHMAHPQTSAPAPHELTHAAVGSESA